MLSIATVNHQHEVVCEKTNGIDPRCQWNGYKADAVALDYIVQSIYATSQWCATLISMGGSRVGLGHRPQF